MKNNVLKRFYIILLAVCLLSGHICVSASAYDAMEYPRLYESEQVPAADTLSRYADVDELRAYIFEAFKEMPEGKVDISKFDMPMDAFDALKEFIWREMPECFQINGLRWFASNNKLTGLAASYKYAETKEQYKSMFAECEAKAAVILDGIKDNDSLSEVEKALLIHDRLAMICSYCTDQNVDVRYTMYGALVRGLAVCDGYARAYAYLLRLAGIENINCSSETLNHAWNLVLIDGKYYHVDVTWDDPSITSGSKSNEGAVKHTNFMLSNEAIKANKHDATDYYTPGNDNKYDNYYWSGSETEFQLLDGKIYYFDNATGELKSLNEDRTSGTALYKVSDKWWSGDGSTYWVGNFSRLSSDGESLFFSSSDTVYIYDVERGEAAPVFKPKTGKGDLIYGLIYRNGYLICDINDCPYGSVSRLKEEKMLFTEYEWVEGAEISGEVKIVGNIEVTFDVLDKDGNVISTVTSNGGAFTLTAGEGSEYIEITAPGHIGKIYSVGYLVQFGLDSVKLDLVGDTNGDDELNNKDVTVLFRALSSTDNKYDDASDVNADGEENNKDVTLLFRFLSDPKQTLKTHSVKIEW